MSEYGSKKRDLEPMSDLVDGVVASLGGRVGLGDAAALWAEWPQLAGEKWASARPLKLDAGVLSVAVPDGMTATRLRYDVGRLMRRIEECLGPNIVGGVRLKVDRPRQRS